MFVQEAGCMRFVTSVKYSIGFVTASCVAVALGGSALAADTYSIDTLDHPVATVEESVLDNPATSSESMSTSSEKSQVVDVTVGSKVVPTGTTVRIDTSVPEAVGSGEPVSAAVLSLVSESVSTASTYVGAPESSVSTPQSHPFGIITETSQASSGSVGTESVSNQPEPIVLPEGTTANSQLLQSDQAAPSLVLGEQRLLIQPLITARPAIPADLAATVPSAPIRSSVPVPTKSTGLLSALTVGLASTVVSQIVLSAVMQPIYDLGWSIVGVIASLVLVSLVGLSFGLWLRRTGLVTAPRSDVATHQQLIFATFQFMGYVPALPDRHNPFFVMSDTKTFSEVLVRNLRKEKMS